MAGEDVTAYESVTRYMVEDLMREVRDLRKRVDGLLWLAASALLMDVILRVAGVQ